MKKAFALLISGSFIASPGFAVPVSTSDAFVTLTRTSISQQDLPTSTQILTPAEFDSWSPQTAGEAVERMTSAQINKFQGLGGAETVQIRGGTTKQSLILQDGRPVNGLSFSQYQDLTEIPIEAIDHIEMVRGSISALYGPNAMGGALNIITRRGPTDGKADLSAGYDYGSYGRNIFRASAGSKLGPVDYFAYGDTQHEDGFRQNSGGHTDNIGLNLGVQLPASSKLLIDMSNYQADIGVPGKNFTPVNQFNDEIERTATTPHAEQVTDSKALRLAYDVPLPMNSLLSVKTWGTDRRVKFTDDFSNSDSLQSSRGASLQASLPLGFLVGGDFIHDHEDSTDHFTPTNSFIAHTENYGLFAQDTMKWKTITLIPSGRFDHNSLFGDTANPRVQTWVDAMSWLRFSGSAARSVRAPQIDDVFYPFTDFGTFANDSTDPATRYTDSTFGGNPDLKPEKAWTYDAGFELHNDAASFKATYFRANVSNLIQNVELFTTHSGTLADPDVDAFTTVNVGEARRQGAEIEIAHRWNDFLRDDWNYTYLQNVGKPLGFTEFVPLAYSPRHRANGSFTVSPFKVLDITNTARYIDSRYSGDNHTGQKLASVLLWDMRIAYRWKILESYFQVSNVTDRHYEEQAFYPQPGRTYIGGVTVHFGWSNQP